MTHIIPHKLGCEEVILKSTGQGKDQTTDGGGQRTEGGGQMTEDRRGKGRNWGRGKIRRQRAEDRRRKGGKIRGQRVEVRGRRWSLGSGEVGKIY